MQCAFCGHSLEPGQNQCPRCGGAVASSPPVETGQIYSSTTFPVPEVYQSSSSPPSSQPSPQPAQPQAQSSDPEADLRTQMVSIGDRQEVIETKLVEAPPPVDVPVTLEKKGLPDSRVARGVEDKLLEIKRIIYRFGRVGRLAFYSYGLVIFGAVSPWFYLPRQGYTPGIEGWGAAAVGLALAGVGTLLWRHRRIPTHRVIPVLLHLVIAAGLVLFLLWRYQQTQEIASHLRPSFAFGFYLSGAGSLGALFGALLGLKNIR